MVFQTFYWFTNSQQRCDTTITTAFNYPLTLLHTSPCCCVDCLSWWTLVFFLDFSQVLMLQELVLVLAQHLQTNTAKIHRWKSRKSQRQMNEKTQTTTPFNTINAELSHSADGFFHTHSGFFYRMV